MADGIHKPLAIAALRRSPFFWTGFAVVVFCGWFWWYACHRITYAAYARPFETMISFGSGSGRMGFSRSTSDLVSKAPAPFWVFQDYANDSGIETFASASPWGCELGRPQIRFRTSYLESRIFFPAWVPLAISLPVWVSGLFLIARRRSRIEAESGIDPLTIAE